MTRTYVIDDCPRADEHTPAPDGYVAWHEWAEQMARDGHTQRRCDGCGHWRIWTPPSGGK